MALDPSDPEAIRAAAREILSQPEFSSEKITWWKQVLFYISHPTVILEDLMRWIASRFTGSGVGVIVAWVMVVAAIAIVVTIVVLLTRSTSRDRMTPVGMVAAGRERTSAELIADAEDAESEAKWREALRLRYSALVVQLGVMGIVRIRPGKTTGEYLNEVRSNWPDVSINFAKATELFEWAWYGDGNPTSSDVETFKSYAASVGQKSVR